MNPRVALLSAALRWLLLPPALACATLGSDAPSSSNSTTTNTPPPATSRSDFATYRVIAERNIFNAGRSGRTGPSANRETRRPPRVDTVALVGIMSYEKGTFAFFEGSSSEFRQVLKKGGTIAGYTLREITPAGVQLQAGEKTLQLKVNSQLRREDEGEWAITARTDSSTSSTSGSDGGGSRRDRRESRSSESGGTTTAAASESAAPAVDASEILKRLMQQREQELK